MNGREDMDPDNAARQFATQVGDREIVVTRVLNAPRELVFDAWTKEEHLTKWWGPPLALHQSLHDASMSSHVIILQLAFLHTSQKVKGIRK